VSILIGIGAGAGRCRGWQPRDGRVLEVQVRVEGAEDLKIGSADVGWRNDALSADGRVARAMPACGCVHGG
jgi:hypothetical protein